MDRIECALEVGEYLHELSHIFAWRDIDRAACAQVHHEAREESLSGAHCLKREVGDVVAHPCNETAHFVARKCGEVHVFEDELDVLNSLVNSCALIREETHSVARLVFREREKADEQDERNEDEDERCHGYERTERRTKRLISMRSPNFCVASSRRLRTVLVSSLMNSCSART